MIPVTWNDLPSGKLLYGHLSALPQRGDTVYVDAYQRVVTHVVWDVGWGKSASVRIDLENRDART